MSFDWRPESKDRYFRKAEAAVKAAGFDDILQISKEQFAITKSTVKVYFKPIPREGKTRRWWEAKKSIAGMQEQSGGRDEFGRKKKTIFIHDLQSGRLRDVISSMLHVSKTKIAQIEAINNNLIPEWKEELKKERLTFSAAYELSGMTEDEQRETLGKFSETGELTHKEVKDMKEAKAAGQQVSESDTEENGMNPPEARAGDDYETPHPEGITSLCYSCTEYETCNVKTGTCTSCDQYKNRAEAWVI